MNQETAIMNKITIALSEAGVPVWRNNVGAYKTEAGAFVRFGVGGKGGSDLIGITPVTVTPEMVGKKLGIFTAVEVKTPKKNTFAC